MPEYPDDLLKEIADMRRRLDQLYTSAQNRAPITKFSQPLTLVNSSTPATPSGACAIYAVSGQLRVIYGDGTVHQIPDVAAAVANPPVFTSPANPGATVTVAAYQALRDDCQTGLRATLIALQTNMRTAGSLAT